MIVSHGVYLANLNQDLDLVYFSSSKSIGIYYTVKDITSDSIDWKHGMPLCDGLVNCEHPRTWNVYSDSAHKVKKMCEKYGYNEIDERMIIKAINEIVSDIGSIRDKIMDKKKEVKKREPFHITCGDCECYGCFKKNECGECR